MTEAENPIAVQLFGSDPQIMADMAKKTFEERPFDVIDVNMGCPVPKVVNNGEAFGTYEKSCACRPDC